jgi:hypothetical protein
MCNDKIKQIKNLLKTFLKDNGIPSKEELLKKISMFEIVCEHKLTEKEKKELMEDILYENQYYITIDSEISKNEYREWLSEWEKQQKIKGVKDYFYYSDRYERYLLEEKGFPPVIVKNISEINKKILNYLPNPEKPGKWLTKGLVMGYVQSGKTANYISLINRAADVGYKFIILIAGVHNNLRSQTQQRINEGFVGFDSLKKQTVGVGKIDPRRRPYTITTVNEDFKKNLVAHFGFSPNDFKEPVILVIKKNSNTLKNLIQWLKTAKLKRSDADYPLLLIDDEADNASINTKTEENPTTINGLIREILNMFNRRVYIGYTATPFANIFIDHEATHEQKGTDLFPDDFIITLNAPENYIGAKTIFLDKKFQGKEYDIIRHITDNEICIPAKPPKNFELNCLPDSLKEAIRLFVLASVIKTERDKKLKYTTMLINVTFKKDLHDRLKHLVNEELSKILDGVYARDKQILKELKELYINEYVSNTYKNEFQISPEMFDNYIEKIGENIDKFKVVAVNSDNKDGLNYNEYPKGLFAIAIGGYSLSRGFTLEGLTISYFIRTTKMYDTLLQMGRWFGYRNKYEDLCRIYMPEETELWYQHIAEVVEELKYDLKELQLSNRPPKDYGLKIRTHPDSLLITARNKMQNTGEFVDCQYVCYSGQLIETRLISTDKRKTEINFNIFNEFIENLSGNFSYIKNKNNYLFKNIPYKVVTDILNGFEDNMTIKRFMEPESFKNSLIDYILNGSDYELSEWDIALKSINSNDRVRIENIELGITKRSVLEDDGFYLLSGKKYRLGDPYDEAIGLDMEKIKADYKTEQIKELKKNNREDDKTGKSIKNTPPGKFIRKYRTKPLLIFYVLDLYKGSVKNGEVIEKNVIAYAISFPETKDIICSNDRVAKYKVNKVFLEELFEKEKDNYEY